ncbi:MAG TPA: hypothetical protein VK850_19120 [Candidatus Binatia bacterium]|nr:hypothetical protein [Candidatus Binatia bacterium]
MSCFSSATNITSTAAPDSGKHVNYNLGMVLGVDDFMQEFAYLSGRDQSMARDLIGYGTARGLRVRTEVDSEKGPRVVVEPGVAVSPSGQMICVPSAQCAYLRDWVGSHESEISADLASPINSTVSAYVVLCYRDCRVDNVPIAGEPCRSEDQLMAPSRVKDDFCLQLRMQKPNQREEDSIRDFVVWLRQIPVPEFGKSTPLNEFLDGIRAAAASWFTSPPPSSPPNDFMFGSPPGSFHIAAMDSCKYMAAAFRLWVTELRPKWIARWQGCAASHFDGDDATDEDCVLLAELIVPVEPNSPGPWHVPNAQVEVHDSARPYLIHLRMLQDWITCGVRPQAGNELRIRNVSGGGTIHVAAADELLLCDTSAGGVLSVNLPPAGIYPGRVVTFKRTTTGSQVRIFPTNTEQIDNRAAGTAFPLTAGFNFVQLASGGKDAWFVIASG